MKTKTNIVGFRAGKDDFADLQVIEDFIKQGRITLGRARSAAVRYAVQEIARQIRERGRA